MLFIGKLQNVFTREQAAYCDSSTERRVELNGLDGRISGSILGVAFLFKDWLGFPRGCFPKQRPVWFPRVPVLTFLFVLCPPINQIDASLDALKIRRGTQPYWMSPSQIPMMAPVDIKPIIKTFPRKKAISQRSKEATQCLDGYQPLGSTPYVTVGDTSDCFQIV
jgi:hypothetical protein